MKKNRSWASSGYTQKGLSLILGGTTTVMKKGMEIVARHRVFGRKGCHKKRGMNEVNR